MLEQEIDWAAQWALFAPEFDGMYSHWDLAPWGAPEARFRLICGGGFGDGSHPTTRVTLRLMSRLRWRGVQFVDIGCGSGILSMAALALGASRGTALDLCEVARSHTSRNRDLNGWSEGQLEVAQQLSSPISAPLVGLMNMLPHEQQLAWQAAADCMPKGSLIVVSGVWSETKESYLAWARQQNWSLQQEEREEDWWGFLFAL